MVLAFGTGPSARNIEPSSLLRAAEREEAVLRNHGIAFDVLDEIGYPAALAAIHDPPLVLYRRGEHSEPDSGRPAVGIVGTRRPTDAGRRQAFRLALECALSGYPVVSGLAYGIDGAAHQGALAALAPNYAVLAGGLDRPSPRGHLPLARRILENGGALIGEIPPGRMPARYAFPRRNRILSGLCRGVVVVQAPRRSGALITADFALEQGRDLFVGTEGFSGAASAGSRELAQQGAPVVDSAAAVLAEWGRCDGAIAVEPLDEPADAAALAAMMKSELDGRIYRHRGGSFERRSG